MMKKKKLLKKLQRYTNNNRADKRVVKHIHENEDRDLVDFTYVAGDEVTEFAMIPFNLGQVHFILQILCLIAGQIAMGHE